MCKNFVSDLVQKMGGDDLFAARVGVSRSTVFNWKRSNLIPQPKRNDVIVAAQDLKIIIRGSDFVYGMKDEGK